MIFSLAGLEIVPSTSTNIHLRHKVTAAPDNFIEYNNIFFSAPVYFMGG
jgi:hypothetical protein